MHELRISIKIKFIIIFGLTLISLVLFNNKTYAAIHGLYTSTNTTTPCASCHSTHNGQDKYINAYSSEYNLCWVCHNSTSGRWATSFPNNFQHYDINSTKTYCSGCHDPHKNPTVTPRLLWSPYIVKTTSSGAASNFQLCFDCHNSFAAGRPKSYKVDYENIYQFYNKSTNAGSGTEGIDKGHFIRNSGHLFSDGTAVPQGFQLACTDCHDRHGSSNQKLLKTKLGTSNNTITLSGGASLTVSDERNFCNGCHNGTNRLYNAASGSVIPWDPSLNPGHTDNAVKCTFCHGGNGTDAQKAMSGAHAPSRESPGNMACTNCHQNITNVTTGTSSTFHHVATNFISDPVLKYNQNQACLQCHVDHDFFRPDMGTGKNRAGNLRQFTGDNPNGYTFSGTSIPAFTDYIGKTTAPWNDTTYAYNGGICISCHYQQQSRSYTGSPRTGTPTLPVSIASVAKDAAGIYDISAHDYTATSNFNFGGSSTFYANCSKCHNDNITKKYQTGNQFATHSSDYSSILSPFGDGTLTPPDMDENFCFKCHDTTGDKYGTTMARGKGVKADFNMTSKHDLTKVKCTNCHNPHIVTKDTFAAGLATSDLTDPDNTFKYFAQTAATNTTTGRLSQFCIKCHDGAPPVQNRTTSTILIPFGVNFPATAFTSTGSGWNKSAFTSSIHWNNNKECSLCHANHGSNYPWLTLASDENNCLTANCHGTGGTKNVSADLAKAYKHPVTTSSGKHSNTENYTTLTKTSGNRHSECTDCHDPHTASNGSATEVDKLGTVTGISITNWTSYNWSNWSTIPAGNFNLVTLSSSDPNNKYEYQLCLKCHSRYSYANDPPTTPSSTFVETDQAQEFNPANPAGHVVAPGVTNDTHIPTFTNSSTTYYYGKFVAPWTATSKVKCTDCHESDSGLNGPHGSAQKFILKARWATSGAMQSTDLCFKCHDYNFYYVSDTGSATVRSQFSSGTNYNLHTSKHSGNKQVNGCASCHGAIPHGWYHTDLSGGGLSLIGRFDPAPYNTGAYLGNIGDPTTGASRQPGQWSSQHSGTSCGNTGGCT